MWLGVVGRSEEALVGTPEKIVTCHAVERMPTDERWSWEFAILISGTLGGEKSHHRRCSEEMGSNEETIGGDDTIEARRCQIRLGDRRDVHHRSAVDSARNMGFCAGCKVDLRKRGPNFEMWISMRTHTEVNQKIN